MTTDGDLARYLADRALHHARNVQKVLDQLTPFERRLVREVAVMGYVRGQMYGRDDRLPADHIMIRDVVDSLIAADDERFPLTAALLNGRRPEVTEAAGHIPGNPDGNR